MYVLYVKEKKPEEKADEKTKPGANRNPPPNPIRLHNGVRFSKKKPQPCEVTKVWGINEKYIYAKQISFLCFSLFFFFYNKFHWIQFKISKWDPGTNTRKTRKFKWTMQNQIHSYWCSTILNSNRDKSLSPVSTECGSHAEKKLQNEGFQISDLSSDCCTDHSLEKHNTACNNRTWHFSLDQLIIPG